MIPDQRRVGTLSFERRLCRRRSREASSELAAPAAAGLAPDVDGFVRTAIVVLQALGGAVALGSRRFENLAVGDSDEPVASSGRRRVALAGLELGLHQIAVGVVPDDFRAAGVE